MNTNWIFLVISLIVAADYAASSISTQVSAFEYDVFRWAPLDKSQCKFFRNELGKGEDADNTPEQNAALDCGRYTRALACYLAFYGDSDTAPQAKLDLDENDRKPLDAGCPAAAQQASAQQK